MYARRSRVVWWATLLAPKTPVTSLQLRNPRPCHHRARSRPNPSPPLHLGLQYLSRHKIHTTTQAGRGGVDLGPVEELSRLYPHDQNEFSKIPDTSLVESVAHYLSSSLRRDGVLPQQSLPVLEVKEREGRLVAWIDDDGDTPNNEALGHYCRTALDPFLRVGKIGYRAYQNFLRDHPPDNNDKRSFFLPHGLAMTQHVALEFMHFPPDYTMQEDCDYLAAQTTERWGDLLRNSGVKVDWGESCIDRYQTIVDLLPIAAPSLAGRSLTERGVHIYFAEYTKELLALWSTPTTQCSSVLSGETDNSKAVRVRPMVVFGYPVRQWLHSEFHLDDSFMSVPCFVDLPMEKRSTNSGSLFIPTVTANHPSYFYNLARRFAIDGANGEERSSRDEQQRALFRIMQEDLIVARWQAKMGGAFVENQTKLLAFDPATVLQECAGHWRDPLQEERICNLVEAHKKKFLNRKVPTN